MNRGAARPRAGLANALHAIWRQTGQRPADPPALSQRQAIDEAVL